MGVIRRLEPVADCGPATERRKVSGVAVRIPLDVDAASSTSNGTAPWRGLEAARVERNIRYNVLHGVAANVALNLATPFLGIFALKMGASNAQVALLSSGPAIVSLLAMIPGAVYVDRFPLKKRVTAAFFLANRIFYLALALVPLFDPDRRAAALVALVALMNLPGAIGNVAWQSFVAAVVPPAQRAQAFARRNRWMNIVGTATVVVAGRVLDVISYPLGYQIVLVAAFAAAMAEIYVFTLIEEPAPADGPGPNPGPTLAGGPPVAAAGARGAVRAGAGAAAPRAFGRTPAPAFRAALAEAAADIARHPEFVRYTAASIVFYFMWQAAWPLFTLYQVKVLGANNLWISLLQIANTGGAMFGYGFWARLADTRGHMRSLVVSTAGICLVPFYYALSHSLLTITVLNLGTGVIFSGVNLSLFNALLERVPDRHTTRYIAYYNWAVALATVAAPLAGVSLLSLLRNSYFWAFIVCAVGRVLGSLCFYLIARRERAWGRPA